MIRGSVALTPLESWILLNAACYYLLRALERRSKNRAFWRGFWRTFGLRELEDI